MKVYIVYYETVSQIPVPTSYNPNTGTYMETHESKQWHFAGILEASSPTEAAEKQAKITGAPARYLALSGDVSAVEFKAA